VAQEDGASKRAQLLEMMGRRRLADTPDDEPLTGGIVTAEGGESEGVGGREEGEREKGKSRRGRSERRERYLLDGLSQQPPLPPTPRRQGAAARRRPPRSRHNTPTRPHRPERTTGGWTVGEVTPLRRTGTGHRETARGRAGHAVLRDGSGGRRGRASFF